MISQVHTYRHGGNHLDLSDRACVAVVSGAVTRLHAGAGSAGTYLGRRHVTGGA